MKFSTIIAAFIVCSTPIAAQAQDWKQWVDHNREKQDALYNQAAKDMYDADWCVKMTGKSANNANDALDAQDLGNTSLEASIEENKKASHDRRLGNIWNPADFQTTEYRGRAASRRKNHYSNADAHLENSEKHFSDAKKSYRQAQKKAKIANRQASRVSAKLANGFCK